MTPSPHSGRGAGAEGDYEWQERAAIMQYDGGLGRLEAERLATERPWDDDPSWGMPKPKQMEMNLGLPPYLQRVVDKYCKR